MSTAMKNVAMYFNITYAVLRKSRSNCTQLRFPPQYIQLSNKEAQEMSERTHVHTTENTSFAVDKVLALCTSIDNRIFTHCSPRVTAFYQALLTYAFSVTCYFSFTIFLLPLLRMRLSFNTRVRSVVYLEKNSVNVFQQKRRSL